MFQGSSSSRRLSGTQRGFFGRQLGGTEQAKEEVKEEARRRSRRRSGRRPRRSPRRRWTLKSPNPQKKKDELCRFLTHMTHCLDKIP